ncbi:response regulator [Kangiella japonica]
MTKRALIVDDSRTAYMVLAKILSNYNIEGIHAKSGDAALEYLARHSVDVIFMDQAMPGKDGFETIKEIKEDSRSKDIPIMMFTARSGEDYYREVKEIGAEGVLPKELSAEEVEDALIKLNLWGAISGQATAEEVREDILQPTSDEKLRVWLESFLENEFSPQLSNKVRKATDDLRRDTIHYGKRMLDEIAKSDKQQQVLQEVKGQTDYLKQLFKTSFKQYRLISSIFIVLLVVLTSGIVWLLYKTSVLTSEQQGLYQKIVVLTAESSEGERRLSDKIAKQSENMAKLLTEQTNNVSAAVNENEGIYSEQGMVGKLIGVESEGSRLTAKSAYGYLFTVTPQGRLARSNLKRYYMEPGCNGATYANALAGLVLKLEGNTLAYTELQGYALVQQPVSWLDTHDQCHEYSENEEVVLRQLLVNDERITGVTDTVYYQLNQ